MCIRDSLTILVVTKSLFYLIEYFYRHLNQHFTKRTIKNEWCDHYMHSIEKVKKFEKVQDVCEKEFNLFSTDLNWFDYVWLNFQICHYEKYCLYSLQYLYPVNNAPIQLAMNIWRDEMIEKVHEPLVTAILQDITRDRRGVSTHSNILRDVIHSFVEVRVHRAVDLFYVLGNE